MPLSRMLAEVMQDGVRLEIWIAVQCLAMGLTWLAGSAQKYLSSGKKSVLTGEPRLRNRFTDGASPRGLLLTCASLVAAWLSAWACPTGSNVSWASRQDNTRQRPRVGLSHRSRKFESVISGDVATLGDGVCCRTIDRFEEAVVVRIARCRDERRGLMLGYVRMLVGSKIVWKIVLATTVDGTIASRRDR